MEVALLHHSRCQRGHHLCLLPLRFAGGPGHTLFDYLQKFILVSYILLNMHILMSTPWCVENSSKVQQCHPWISSNARCSITSRTRGRPHGNTSLLEMFSSSLSKTNHKQYFLKQFLNNLKNNQTINLKLVFIKVHFVSFWKISISLTNMFLGLNGFPVRILPQ